LSAEATHCELTPTTLADLDHIWRYGAEIWSVDQADRFVDDLARVFELLVAMPSLARERPGFTPPVRIHVHAQHIIVHVLQQQMVLIVRNLGGHQNWQVIL
jgi:toxin ParE1/3/4